ncbi:hypothetical protein KBK24_0120505 [Burkholderia sp. K24]|nr:hypothetical protein KBK24_0120505 [Burkholderia sp. K24]
MLSEIYVGAPIDQDSERQFLSSIVRWLEEGRFSFVILANVHIGGRQIDCIVATERSVSVIEVKSSYLPVRGDLNGNWARLYASGEWGTYTNAYQQVLAAKNAVRDAMAAKPVGKFYPDGHVVFASGLPEGSRVTTGDFKATVTTLDQFLSSFNIQSGSPWALSDWQALALRLKLTPASLDDAVASPEDWKAAECLKQYNAVFAVEYGRDAARWLPEDAGQRSTLLAAATTGPGCFISGPSGCGKTLMVKWLAAELANAGNPTFFFAAKDFTGSWAEFIRREVGLLSDHNPSALLRSIAQADKPIFLVLDGINELGAHGQNAVRGICALARRFGAKLIVTGQQTKPAAFDGLGSITINRPSVDLKRRIARAAGVPVSAAALEVLKAVGSGIEAEIVGQIGGDLNAGATRLVLLDQYIRMRLGRHGRAASFGLRRLASSFHELVAFSMSEANFDEFMRQWQVGFEDCDALFTANLLVRRAGRISFSHEMLQNACAAFDIARKAEADPMTLGFRLSAPLLEGIAGDIVSAIEDTATCRAVLGEVRSPVLLAAAADGELGPVAGSVAQALLVETANACRIEIQSARLVLLTEGDSVRVDWADDGRQDWTEAECARLCAIGQRAAAGAWLDGYLELCARMDERLTSERKRLAEAAREVSFPLRSRSFELAYYGFGTRIGFTHVARAGHPSFRELPAEAKRRQFSLAAMSSGQVHFFLENRRAFFGDADACQFAEELIYLMRERFRFEPYHVQLAALHAAGFARLAPAETVERLVKSIDALDVAPTNWAISTSIIDALKMLGALDDEGEGSREQIRSELASVLGDDESLVDRDLALSLCLRMFDHPFDSIYCEEIDALDENLRRRLYRRALGASDIKKCMSLSWLSGKVASFEDMADVSLMQPLATLPESSNPFPQEEWGGFVVAIRFLGRHGAELPGTDDELPASLCLSEIRILIYAAESRRPPDMERARQAWRTLHAMPTQLVVGCLSEVHAALTERHWSETDRTYDALNLVEVYPADCLKVARRFVEDGVDAQYFHRVPMRELGPLFAFGTVGRYGDRSDLDLLRRLVPAHRFTRYALTAIKSLDAIAG